VIDVRGVEEIEIGIEIDLEIDLEVEIGGDIEDIEDIKFKKKFII